MNVNIETQYICIDRKYMRGIPLYILSLIDALRKRNNNHYSISFFDKDRERNNRRYIDEYLSGIIDEKDILECNDLDYRMFMKALRTGDASGYNERSYGDYIGKKADVYHFPNPYCIPLNVEGVMVVTVHDLIPFAGGAAHESKEIADNALKELKASMEYIKDNEITILSDSEHTKRDIIKFFNIDSSLIHVVPLGYSFDPENRIYGERSGELLNDMGIEKPYILYLGALDPRKGTDVIADAFKLIKNTDVNLVLAGTGGQWAEDVLKPGLRGMEEKGRVIFPGYVSEEQKYALLSNAEIFLFPSEYEGFGLPVLEAMTCGCPVITTNVSSLPEVGGDAVEYVSPKNSEELAEKIDKILGDREYADELKKKGLDQSKLFSWEKTAALTEDVYRIAFERGR